MLVNGDTNAQSYGEPVQGLTVGEQIRFSADLRNPKEGGNYELKGFCHRVYGVYAGSLSLSHSLCQLTQQKKTLSRSFYLPLFALFLNIFRLMILALFFSHAQMDMDMHHIRVGLVTSR